MHILPKYDVPDESPDQSKPSRLATQLASIDAEECLKNGEMLIFPMPFDSGSLAAISRVPNLIIDRIGPDVVKVRRA